jgi:predicted neutral ceramidase superfamily lipid hydrolase
MRRLIYLVLIDIACLHDSPCTARLLYPIALFGLFRLLIILPALNNQSVLTNLTRDSIDHPLYHVFLQP